METYLGCLLDTATGDVIDAGVIRVAETGHLTVSHGPQPDGAHHSAPYLPNAQHAVLSANTNLN